MKPSNQQQPPPGTPFSSLPLNTAWHRTGASKPNFKALDLKDLSRSVNVWVNSQSTKTSLHPETLRIFSPMTFGALQRGTQADIWSPFKFGEELYRPSNTSLFGPPDGKPVPNRIDGSWTVGSSAPPPPPPGFLPRFHTLSPQRPQPQQPPQQKTQHPQNHVNNNLHIPAASPTVMPSSAMSTATKQQHQHQQLPSNTFSPNSSRRRPIKVTNTTENSNVDTRFNKASTKNPRDDPRSLVLGKEIKLTATKVTGLMQIQHRMIRLKRRANDGFGIVPVRDRFTVQSQSHQHDDDNDVDKPTSEFLLSSVLEQHEDGDEDNIENVNNTDTPPKRLNSIQKILLRPLQPGSVTLIQVAYENGRQAMFQSFPTMMSGGNIDGGMMNKHVLITCSGDGMDVALLRAMEPLSELVPNVPEVPFQRVVRLAGSREICLLPEKRRQEHAIAQAALTIHSNSPAIHVCKIVMVELQWDRKRAILYVETPVFVNLDEFAIAVRDEARFVTGNASLLVDVVRRFGAATTTGS